MLERSILDEATATSFDLLHLLGSQSFIRIAGLTDFWSTHPEIDFGQYITDLVISTHNQTGHYLVVVFAGTPQKLSVYLSLGEAAMTQAFIEGVLPGVRVEVEAATGKPYVFNDLAATLAPHFCEKGGISGIPSRKTSSQVSHGSNRSTNRSHAGMADTAPSAPETTESQGLSHLERVVRGMSGTTWAYVVRAYPRPRNAVVQERLDTIDDLANVASQVRGQLQKNTQVGQTLTASKNTSYTETMSGEIVNYRAQYLMQLLERDLARKDQALAVGQWTVDVCFGAATSWDAQRLASLLVGTLAGSDSRTDHLRSYKCENNLDSLYVDQFKTYLSSEEVSTLIQLPREEVPGYAIHDFVRFDVDFEASNPPTIDLGIIQHNTKDTSDTYRIRLDDLTKHALIVGVTGSGKTTTLLHLLDHATSASVPFLVIEPVKTEYRALRAALAPTIDVHVYTLGNENIAPFRFNPFEFETTDIPGSGALLNHVDFLKAVFNAAFVLYAPMPYILETALHEIYQDKGWDIASGRNTRLPDADWSKRHLYPIFPTLTELYQKVENVTTRLNYYDEVERNVIAGLKARIGLVTLRLKRLYA